MNADPSAVRPLAGVRVLELAQVLAAPFAGYLLAAFGAEVIKVEPPGEGDPIRRWRLLDEDGTSLWWRSLARNKRSVTLDLRRREGQELARRLAAQSDLLLENFRPGTLEGWGLAPEELARENPRLIAVRISGYGQTGPYAARPGYASVCEAVGGLRHLTGEPGEPPLRANLSLGDSLAGLFAAFGALVALLERTASGRGQVVDAAIVESVFAVLESTVPEFDRLGVVRGPSGRTIGGIAPSNLYPTADGAGVVIGANSEGNFARLMGAIGRPDLAADPGLAGNPARVARQAELDEAIAAWTRTLPAREVVERLAAVAVPCGRAYTVADMAADAQFAARGLFERVEVGGRPLAVPATVPKLSRTPGGSEWAGPELGAHNREVLCGLLGLSEARLAELRAEGIV